MAVFRSGATALITGAGSGIGFAFASVCRRHGMNLLLLDSREDNLKTALSTLQLLGSQSGFPDAKSEGHVIDVSDRSAWPKLKSKITESYSSIEILMLNAGILASHTAAQSWEDLDYFERTFNTNLIGVLNGLASFLPLVQKGQRSSPEGKSAVIITGSKQGITNPPGANNPAYNASKSALKTVAEHLAYDLRTSSHPSYTPGTSVHLLIPGWTFTGMSGNPGPISSQDTLVKRNQGAWLPEQVAQYAERKINEGKFYILCPDDDVDEALDQARMTWAMGDVVEGRPALSRWEDGMKKEAADWIEKEAQRRRAGKSETQ